MRISLLSFSTAALLVLASAGTVQAMCGGGAQNAGRNQCGGSMSMGGMRGMGAMPGQGSEAARPAAPAQKPEADSHAGMDMSGTAKGGMGNMRMAGGGCCCGCCGGGQAAGGRAGGMCGGGMGMNMQEDHTKDPLLTDPMWDQKPTAPQNPPQR